MHIVCAGLYVLGDRSYLYRYESPNKKKYAQDG